MAVWDKYGLISSRFFSGRNADPRYAALPRAARFRQALEENGGLFVLFGHFLRGRADLLPYPHLRQLRKIGPYRNPARAPALDRELMCRVTHLQFMRIAPGAEIFSGMCQDRPVVVEFYSIGADSLEQAAWKRFSSEIKALEDEVEGQAARPRSLNQFEEWLSLARDVSRKRAILENLDSVPAGCITCFPCLIPELQTENCLVYDGLYSQLPALDIRPEEPQAGKQLQLLGESLLEQSLLISLVDAEVQPDNYAAIGNGSLGFRNVPVLAPVPVEWHYELLQYMASTIAGQSPRALHMLSRICASHDPYAGEQRLIRELSGLQPELKINMVTPESVSALENYWRTLAGAGMRPPLFLELFHRQWTLFGQDNGEVALTEDLIAESLWPVMARILRYRFSELASVDKGREWAANSGLMLITAARQVGMLLEQVRDNDLAVVLDHQHDQSGESKLNQRTLSLVRSTLILAIFLLAVYLSINAPWAAAKPIAGLTAAISAAALAFFAARIE